jgi:hypothetical protein
MKRKFLTLRRTITFAVPFLLLVAIEVAAQMDRKVGQAQQENAAALRSYEWKSRTEIRKGGELKKVQLAQMRYDQNGVLQKTIISTTADEDLPTRGLIGHIAQKKKKHFIEKVDQLGTLAKSYGEIAPDRLQTLIGTAKIGPGGDQLIRVDMHDVLQTGDAMTLFLDAVTRKQRRIEIQTTMEDKPVRIVSEYRDLPLSGTTYLAKSQVTFDTDSISITVENFDHARVNQQAKAGEASELEHEGDWTALLLDFASSPGASSLISATSFGRMLFGRVDNRWRRA